jgi:hypothetical protein
LVENIVLHFRSILARLRLEFSPFSFGRGRLGQPPMPLVPTLSSRALPTGRLRFQ